MELKVWVEGIQRVVCGISEQTTVQEVVIALAQATGRTGRYTLVEKWRDMEKLLPPSEYPMKVLAKWGEYACEVQFLLKRTGASTISSDTENMRGPERNVYRQSLPPPAKNRQKNEPLQGIKRKEPKRKSLTITGGTPAYFGTESQDKRNQSNNNNKGLEISSVPEHVTPSMLKSSALVSNSVTGTSNGKMAGESRSVEKKDRTQNTASPKESKRKNKELKLKNKADQDKKGKQEQKTSKQALMPSHVKKKDGKTSVSSATAVLFPSESMSEVAAKSPAKKNHESLFNKANGKTNRVPLMPPSNKVLRSRTEGNSVEQTQLASASTSFIPVHTRNNSSGAAPSSPLSLTNSNKLDVSSNHYGNSLPRSGRKPWSEWKSMDDWKTAGSENNLAKQKLPLMPPHSHRKHSSSRLRSPPPTPTNFHSRSHSTDRSQRAMPLSGINRNTEYNRAVDEFSRLSLEQQKHIEEQQETVKALDEEVKVILQKMQKIENEVQDEVNQLKERHRLLDPLEDDARLTQELYAEEKRNTNVQREMDQFQTEIDHTNKKLTGYESIIENLTKEICDERYRLQVKQQKEEEENRRLMVKLKQDMDRVKQEVDSTEKELNRMEKECSIKDEDIETKYAELESLNRELRQVKLQQFIRQTGSKVTVLPPNSEDLNDHSGAPRKLKVMVQGWVIQPVGKHRQDNQIQSRLQGPTTFANQKGSRSPIPPAAGQRGGSEGVWV